MLALLTSTTGALSEGATRGRKCVEASSTTGALEHSLPSSHSLRLPPEAVIISRCRVPGLVCGGLAAPWWVRLGWRSPRGKLGRKPGQRDGRSEIGDPPEAAAGGGQEPVGGETPWLSWGFGVGRRVGGGRRE